MRGCLIDNVAYELTDATLSAEDFANLCDTLSQLNLKMLMVKVNFVGRFVRLHRAALSFSQSKFDEFSDLTEQSLENYSDLESQMCAFKLFVQGQAEKMSEIGCGHPQFTDVFEAVIWVWVRGGGGCGRGWVDGWVRSFGVAGGSVRCSAGGWWWLGGGV